MNKKLTALVIVLTMAVTAIARPNCGPGWGHHPHHGHCGGNSAERFWTGVAVGAGTAILGNVVNNLTAPRTTVVQQTVATQPVYQQQMVQQPVYQQAVPAATTAVAQPQYQYGGNAGVAMLDVPQGVVAVDPLPNTVIAPSGAVVNPADQPVPGHTKMWVEGAWVVRGNGDAHGCAPLWVPGHYEYQ